MTKKSTMIRKIMVLVMTIAVMLTYALVPMNQSYAASSKKPKQVKSVSVKATSYTSVKITWKKAKYAKKYQIYRATSKGGKYKKIKTTKSKSYTNKKLKENTKYYYKVRAINGKKKGKFSAIKSVRTKSRLANVEVNTVEKTVTINAKVNGAYFNKSTRHFMIDQDGFNAGKALLTSYCKPADLYNGLVKAGGISWSKSEGKTLGMGQKNTVENAENKNFSKIDVSVSWPDHVYKLEDVLTTEKGGETPPEINMVFTGNPKAAAKTYSGCMVCLDSCYIGMVANNAYGMCVIDNGNPTVYGRPDRLPANGTNIKVIFTIEESL